MVVSFSTKLSRLLQVFANAGVGSAVVASILVAACNIGGTACAGQLLDRHSYHSCHFCHLYHSCHAYHSCHSCPPYSSCHS